MAPEIKTTSYLQSVKVLPIKDFNQSDKVIKILIFIRHNYFKEKDLNNHINNLQNLVKDVEIIKFQFDGYFGIDITTLNATKHTAVLEYCKILGLEKENVVAIGDGYNDYHLFTASGYKIAMGNSPKELKDIADLIVPTVDDGGMEIALKHILNMVK